MDWKQRFAANQIRNMPNEFIKMLCSDITQIIISRVSEVIKAVSESFLYQNPPESTSFFVYLNDERAGQSNEIDNAVEAFVDAFVYGDADFFINVEDNMNKGPFDDLSISEVRDFFNNPISTLKKVVIRFNMVKSETNIPIIGAGILMSKENNDNRIAEIYVDINVGASAMKLSSENSINDILIECLTHEFVHWIDRRSIGVKKIETYNPISGRKRVEQAPIYEKLNPDTNEIEIVPSKYVNNPGETLAFRNSMVHLIEKKVSQLFSQGITDIHTLFNECMRQVSRSMSGPNAYNNELIRMRNKNKMKSFVFNTVKEHLIKLKISNKKNDE